MGQGSGNDRVPDPEAEPADGVDDGVPDAGGVVVEPILVVVLEETGDGVDVPLAVVVRLAEVVWLTLGGGVVVEVHFALDSR